MTIDEAKAMLTELREWAFPEATEALDIALWLLEREASVVEEIRGHGDRFEMIVEAWEREHPRPGS